MQTYLVHMREPRRLWCELGAKRFLGLQVLMGGLILSSLVHPWFYGLLALDLWEGRLLGVSHSFAGRDAAVARRIQSRRRLRERHCAGERRSGTARPRRTRRCTLH